MSDDKDDEVEDGVFDGLDASSETCPLRKYRTKNRILLAMTPNSAATNGRISRTKFCATEAEGKFEDDEEEEEAEAGTDDDDGDGSAFTLPVSTSAP